MKDEEDGAAFSYLSASTNDFEIWSSVASRVEADLKAFANCRVTAVTDDEASGLAHIEIFHPDGFTVPIFVEAAGVEEAVKETFVAVLDSGIFDDTTDPWPTCPLHPHGTHSLAPALSQTNAVWQCPAERIVIARIGTLNRT